MQKTHNAVTGAGSPLRKYQQVIVGSTSFLDFLYFEWCMLLTFFPGAPGMLLRKIFWPRLFAACGKGVMFGAGVVLRHPGRISLGDRVVISEQCVLDGRGERDQTISLGNDVILSNQVILSCKNGRIRIGESVGINSQTIIQSTSDCPVEIGRDCVIGQRCFVIGGGSYNTGRLDIPIREQGIRQDGGVRLEEDIWLGGNVTVLGGVTIGRGSIVGAGAVVTRSIPAQSVALGTPARVVKQRAGGTGGPDGVP